jgi:hypothetical protein
MVLNDLLLCIHQYSDEFTLPALHIKQVVSSMPFDEKYVHLIPIMSCFLVKTFFGHEIKRYRRVLLQDVPADAHIRF